MKILELTLTTPALEQQRSFYCGTLGLLEAEPYWTGRLAVQVGHTRLNLLPALDDWRGYYHFALDVPPNRFEPAARWLRERATPIASLEGQTRFFHENANADAIYFRDPAGNILELIGRRDAPDNQSDLNPQRPFNASEISAISEIGVAASSVSASLAELTERVPGLAPYGGPPSDTFALAGDISGMLVLVINGRIWYPNTGVPAVFLPLDVLIEIQQGNHLQQRYRLTAPPYPFSISPVQ